MIPIKLMITEIAYSDLSSLDKQREKRLLFGYIQKSKIYKGNKTELYRQLRGI
jgi:hypothetical protein